MTPAAWARAVGAPDVAPVPLPGAHGVKTWAVGDTILRHLPLGRAYAQEKAA